MTAATMKESKSRAVPEALLTRAEVAAWLRVEPKEVTRVRNKKGVRIPVVDLGPKTKRFRRSAVEAWLQDT